MKRVVLISLALFLLIIPIVQAEITHQPRYWEESCSIESNENDGQYYYDGMILPFCPVISYEEPKPEHFLSISWEEAEIKPDKWKFKAKPTEKFFDNFTLEELAGIPCEAITDGIEVDCKLMGNEIEIEVEFKDGWKLGEKFSLGTDTITYVSTTKLMTVIGDATCGNTEANYCDFHDLYVADKAGTLEMMANQTGASGMNLTTELRPADNVTIPITFNITGLTSSGTCNVTGTIYNNTNITESVSISDNTTYETNNYFSYIENSTINCSTTFDVQIYQNQWGCIWEENYAGAGDYTKGDYFVDCRIVIGDGSTITWFWERWKQITILSTATTSASGQILIDVKNNASLRFGEIIDETAKISARGVSMFYIFSNHYPGMIKVNGAEGIFEIYSSRFTTTHSTGMLGYVNSVTRQAKIYESNFEYMSGIYGNLDMYRVTAGKMDRAVIPSGQTGIFEDVYVYKNSRYGCIHLASVAGAGPGIFNSIKDLKARNCTAVFRISNVANPSYWNDMEAINVDLDEWTISWSSDPGGPQKLFRKYEFDLTVTNSTGDAISGATIDINTTSTDPNCTTNNHTTTDANGEIITQILSAGFSNKTGGNTIYDCNPYILTISEPTYQTYNTTISFNDKTDLTIALKDTLGSGSCNTTLITNFTYDSTDDYLTVVGGTSADPITMQDIYDCDDFHGYECITTNDLVSYSFACGLQIGNNSAAGNTTFADESITISIDDDTTLHPDGGWMNVKGSAYFKCGVLENATLKTTSRGCAFVSQRTSDTQFIRAIGNPTEIEIYSSWFTAPSSVTSNNIYVKGKIYNSYFIGTFWYSAGGYWTVDAYNIEVTRSAWGWHYATEGTFEDLRFIGVSGVSDIGIYLYAAKATVMKGTIIKGVWTRPIRALDITVDKYLINPTFEDWDLSWGGTSTADIYRQYELDLKVIDNTSAEISRELVGAVVNINSTSTDTKCYNNRTTTNSSGQIDTQTITKGYYNQTGDDTIYSCEPYRFIISKSGYETLNFTANITEETKWHLPMYPPTEEKRTIYCAWYREIQNGYALCLDQDSDFKIILSNNQKISTIPIFPIILVFSVAILIGFIILREVRR